MIHSSRPHAIFFPAIALLLTNIMNFTVKPFLKYWMQRLSSSACSELFAASAEVVSRLYSALLCSYRPVSNYPDNTA